MRESSLPCVAVVGTGLLGRGIARVVVRAGYPVVLHDAHAPTLASAESFVREGAAGASVRAEAILERAVAEAELVVEAVIENLELKQSLFERMGAVNPGAILMSNSSVLPIGDIAARTSHPERTVGTHWWNPPDLIPVVEVVRGPHTLESVMQRAAGFLTKLGKTAVRVDKDVPGFVGNRLQHALWREALAMVSDGVREPREIDRIVAATLGQELALRGPFAEMNLAGPTHVQNEFAQILPLVNSDPRPAALLQSKAKSGQLGAKSGRGFLDWPDGARERAAQRLKAHVEQRLRSPQTAPAQSAGQLATPDIEIARRLRVAVWREAVAMVQAGVCDAATVDLMAMNTIGLRLAAMGPVENADFVGLDLTLAIHDAILPSLNASRDIPQQVLRAALSSQ